jgi:hypothetical protein
MSGLRDEWLTVEADEEIHRAVEKGRPVADFVRGLRHSTLRLHMNAETRAVVRDEHVWRNLEEFERFGLS